MHKPALALALTSLLAACGNVNSTHQHYDLGNASIGQQMIDLQRALEAGAIDVAEYQALKDGLLAAVERAKLKADDGDDD